MALLFSLKPGLKVFLFITAVLCLPACTSLYFYPLKTMFSTPAQGHIDYEAVTFASHDGTLLSAWLLKTKQPRKGVIYFLHGNAENISTHIASVYWLPEQGYDVFLLDYRGFGLSEGEPSLPEVFDDIDAGFNWLLARYPEEKNIFFFGQSIGASMGVYWMAHSGSARTNIKKIILDAPVSSYPQMVSEVLQRSWLTWLFAKPVSWAFTSRYDAYRAAQHLPAETPVLFFHSSDDEVIPFAFSSELFKALPTADKKEIVAQGGHIATFNYSTNRQKLLTFLAK